MPWTTGTELETKLRTCNSSSLLPSSTMLPGLDQKILLFNSTRLGNMLSSYWFVILRCWLGDHDMFTHQHFRAWLTCFLVNIPSGDMIESCPIHPVKAVPARRTGEAFLEERHCCSGKSMHLSEVQRSKLRCPLPAQTFNLTRICLCLGSHHCR